MEVEMVMEDEMEMELVFEVEEIDLDYEFEAARFFDFSREESLDEANEAELWFECAKSYPPSPFVVKLLLREDLILENVKMATSKDVVNTDALLENNWVKEYSTVDVNNRDCEGIDGGVRTNSWSDHLQKTQNQPRKPTMVLESYDNSDRKNFSGKTKSNVKPFPRSSTLMKPTASLLAKQNLGAQIGGSRCQMPSHLSGEKSSCSSSAFESQAAKRQKLERGHLCKASYVNDDVNFIHKLATKDRTLDGNRTHVKLKVTIPREPDLETAHRAQRIRLKNGAETKHDTSIACKFRARPLNRKILEAPTLPIPKRSTPKLPEFQEFHLKTLERAMQHTPVVSSCSILCNDSDKGLHKCSTSSVAEDRNKLCRRPSTADTRKRDQAMHNFKALPLNKKLFSSKGDIGVFRNVKREYTVPVEFNFHTEKWMQNNLPIELFSKLSLTSELQPNDGSMLKMPHPTYITMKGSKENRLNTFQQHDVLEKEKSSIFGGKQSQHGTAQGSRRSLSIR